jgi:hypothetical protein
MSVLLRKLPLADDLEAAAAVAEALALGADVERQGRLLAGLHRGGEPPDLVAQARVLLLEGGAAVELERVDRVVLAGQDVDHVDRHVVAVDEACSCPWRAPCRVSG